jgi:hypothetical protein
MTNGEVPRGLYLRGDLQIDTAVLVLTRHNIGSKVLKMITGYKNTYANMPEHLQNGRSSLTLYLDDPDMKHDLVQSLEQELESTDLDEIVRIGVEELLYIQRNGLREI